MKLYEFEGHRILSKVGIESPFFVVASNISEIKQARKRLKFPIVAKVQVLSGRRGKSGGVKIVNSEKQLLDFAKSHFLQVFGGEEVRFIILSEKVEIEKEFYISITYDTVKKVPFILFSGEGGIEIEEIAKTKPESILRVDIDPLVGPTKKDLQILFANTQPYSSGGFVDFAERLWDAFSRYDCRLIEVNPLAATKNSLVAIDAKVILDDSGLVRHKDLDVLPKGAISAIPTERELAAREIDEVDYRGSAGSVFIELPGSPRSPRGEAGGEAGDIAILASGGGASLLVMDSVMAAGGVPANYTEYSGNPPREKVEKLTKITLENENLSGCLVAGAVANFTDIYETLGGFVDGLRRTRPKPQYPIVIRRGGPRQKEAYEMLKKVARQEGYDIHLFGPQTPISVACREMVELANECKSKIKNQNAK